MDRSTPLVIYFGFVLLDQGGFAIVSVLRQESESSLEMAFKPGIFGHRVSDLVIDSNIEAMWDPDAKETTQIRTAIGVSTRH